jgi:hypothetical protein
LGFALNFFGLAGGGDKREYKKAVKMLAPPSRARIFGFKLPFSFTNLKYFGNIRL